MVRRQPSADGSQGWQVDGIHDSLYRSGGVTLLTEPVAEGVPVPPGTAAADRYDKAA